MRITILSYGSRGDVQPFIALALGLERAGHEVCLAAPRRVSDLAVQYHVPFAALPGDPEEMSAFVNNVRRDALLPRPEDWRSPGVHVTGCFFLDANAAYQPPPEVLGFLGSGDAPVCVTFGSMVSRESERILALVRASLSQSHLRGIILTGWGGKKPVMQETDLLSIESAPHDWLFTRCRSVIHHGGVGTTAAGLRAGIPNIVIPHGIDQKFWGNRVAALGAGPRPIGISRLSVRALTNALEKADSQSVRTCAREAGESIRAEDGVGEAVRFVERHAAQFKRL